MKNMMKNTGRKIKKYVKEDPVGFISFLMILLFIFLAVFADFIAPYGINETQYMKPKAAPSMEHIFGTDELSRDIFSRILYASMRIVDIVLSYPFMILAMAIVYNLGASTKNLFLALILVGWAGTARTVRAQTLSLKNSTYIEAARSMGVSKWKIMIKHILPNIRSLLLVLYTMSIPVAILSEAGLSFLGFGAQPPQTSLGVMVSKGRTYLFDAPWISLAPAIYILLLSLCLNFFGDSLRDMLDSKRSER